MKNRESNCQTKIWWPTYQRPQNEPQPQPLAFGQSQQTDSVTDICPQLIKFDRLRRHGVK
jgi:hypothetical protein